MISTLLVTVVVEGIVVTLYALLRSKPLYPLLLTSLAGNIITQSMLWIVLLSFFRHYLIALIFVEIIVWGVESLFFYAIPANKLKGPEAMFLSLAMNMASLTFGWFLPV